jgi:hypothetical protein
MQQRPALSSPAIDVTLLAVLFELADVAADGLPALDLASA